MRPYVSTKELCFLPERGCTVPRRGYILCTIYCFFLPLCHSQALSRALSLSLCVFLSLALSLYSLSLQLHRKIPATETHVRRKGRLQRPVPKPLGTVAVPAKTFTSEHARCITTTDVDSKYKFVLWCVFNDSRVHANFVHLALAWGVAARLRQGAKLRCINRKGRASQSLCKSVYIYEKERGGGGGGGGRARRTRRTKHSART